MSAGDFDVVVLGAGPAGAGAAIAVVAGKKSNDTVTPAGSGTDDVAAIPDAGVGKSGAVSMVRP